MFHLSSKRLQSTQLREDVDQKLDSDLAVVKVPTQGDVTDQLGPVHQICEESAERRGEDVKASNDTQQQTHTHKRDS